MKTMKKYIHSIVWLACMAVVLSACTKTESIDNLPGEAGGNLQLNFTIDEKMVSGTKADTYDPLATSTLRIYQVESDGAEGTTERLIRKYKPATDTSLYLVSGTYTAAKPPSRTEPTTAKRPSNWLHTKRKPSTSTARSKTLQ